MSEGLNKACAFTYVSLPVEVDAASSPFFYVFFLACHRYPASLHDKGFGSIYITGDAVCQALFGEPAARRLNALRQGRRPRD